eukprot:gnl/TRDRNA2_/TRDRNA2_32719_c0_seq1.p1 gnl/TRDRNA2_/TRDRNA2_32719_c0~~gnl/TRDRNA2_/TRDRNA2_32719_c0_seq1.p1  ORF type:complete len:214 (-),score=21.20 gnl/TRDRNA2_/TRDRNA2_32719_c0_seq1:92-733(-)
MEKYPGHESQSEVDQSSSKNSRVTFDSRDDEVVIFHLEGSTSSSSGATTTATSSTALNAEQEEEELWRAMTSQSWSAGSKLHHSGHCVPCEQFARKAACSAGKECQYCHLPHEGRQKPSRMKRRAIRNAMDGPGLNPEDIWTKTPKRAHTKYTVALLQHKLESHIDGVVDNLQDEGSTVVSEPTTADDPTPCASCPPTRRQRQNGRSGTRISL